MCLFTNCRTYNIHVVDLPLSSILFADNAREVLIHDSMMWLPCSCVGISPVFSVGTELIAETLLVLFFVNTV